jgi:hypothetical protein
MDLCSDFPMKGAEPHRLRSFLESQREIPPVGDLSVLCGHSVKPILGSILPSLSSQ